MRMDRLHRKFYFFCRYQYLALLDPNAYSYGVFETDSGSKAMLILGLISMPEPISIPEPISEPIPELIPEQFPEPIPELIPELIPESIPETGSGPTIRNRFRRKLRG